MDSAKRILIVEDEALTAMALGAYLRREGYEVVGFSATGEEAVQKAREDHPDIVFMDIRLAGRMDGIEAAEAISREERVAFVFMTGHSTQAAVERVAGVALVGYLTKPIDFSDIRGVLSRLA
ncbi:MAG: response regulator [Spirochaetia bacterium]